MLNGTTAVYLAIYLQILANIEKHRFSLSSSVVRDHSSVVGVLSKMDSSKKILDYKEQAKLLHQGDFFHLGKGFETYTAFILVDDNGLITNENTLHVQMNTRIQVLT